MSSIEGEEGLGTRLYMYVTKVGAYLYVTDSVQYLAVGLFMTITCSLVPRPSSPSILHMIN